MTNDPPAPPSDDPLGNPDGALDALRNLQRGFRNTGALRSMFGAFTTLAETTKELVTNARDGVGRRGQRHFVRPVPIYSGSGQLALAPDHPV
jgi:hypothetical protein